MHLVSMGVGLIVGARVTGAVMRTERATAVDVRVIGARIPVVVPITVETTVAVMQSVAETTVEQMTAEAVMRVGGVTSAGQSKEEEMTGVTEIAGRRPAAVRGGESLKLASRLCRGYLLKLLVRFCVKWSTSSCGQ